MEKEMTQSLKRNPYVSFLVYAIKAENISNQKESLFLNLKCLCLLSVVRKLQD